MGGTSTRTVVLSLLLLGVLAPGRVAGACVDYGIGVGPRGSVGLTGAKRVATDGAFAYVLDGGSGLNVVSLADPDAPAVLRRLALPDLGVDVALRGTRLYVLSQTSGLAAYDLTDPAAPTLLGTLSGLGRQTRLAIAWPIAVCTGDLLHVVRLDAGDVPQLLSALPISCTAVDVSGDRACVVSACAVTLVDIADPWRPHVMSSLDFFEDDYEIECSIPAVAIVGSAVLACVERIDWHTMDGFVRLCELDASLPGVLRYVSGAQIDWHPPMTFARSGDLLYLGLNDGRKVLVYDVRAPLTPHLVGWAFTPTGIYHLALGGTIGCAVRNNALQVLDVVPDVAFPPAPVTLETPLPHDVVVNGSVAFLADGTVGLRIIDVSDPAAPVFEGWLPVEGEAVRVVTGEDRLYVLRKLPAGVPVRYAVNTYALGETRRPTYLGTVELPGTILDLESCGRYLWTGSKTQLVGWDLRDPAAPETTMSWPGRVDDLAIDEGQLYAASASGLRRYALTDSGHVQLLGTAAGNLAAVAARGGHVYVVDTQARFLAVDVTDPALPFLGSPVYLPGSCRRLSLRGGFAAAATYAWGTHLIDVREPDAPVYAGLLDTPLQCTASALGPGCLLAAYGAYVGAPNGLIVAAGPCGAETPLLPAAFTASRAPAGVRVAWSPAAAATAAEFRLIGADAAGEWVVPCAADDRGGFGAQDLSAPALSGAALTYRLLWRDDSGEWLQLGKTRLEAALSLAVFTASRAAEGVQVAWSLATAVASVEFRLIGIDLAGEWAVPCAADGQGGFSAQDRSAPALSGAALTYRLLWREGGGDWSQLGETRLEAVSLPQAYRLEAAFPNPFNPRTTLRFDLPSAGQVRLSIYDVHGRLVRTLVRDQYPAGSHTAVWDGRDPGGRAAPSGSYFARMEAGGKIETVRMTLVR